MIQNFHDILSKNGGKVWNSHPKCIREKSTTGPRDGSKPNQNSVQNTSFRGIGKHVEKSATGPHDGSEPRWKRCQILRKPIQNRTPKYRLRDFNSVQNPVKNDTNSQENQRESEHRNINYAVWIASKIPPKNRRGNRRPFPAHREPHPLNRNRGVGVVVATTAWSP